MNESNETIFVDAAGNISVYGPEGEEWYFVITKNANSSDYAMMERLDSGERPYVITDQNIGAWRTWAKESLNRSRGPL